MDLRKPGEEEDEYSEMAEEAMDPENCFPDGKIHAWPKTDVLIYTVIFDVSEPDMVG